jgi:hypothetical protein
MKADLSALLAGGASGVYRCPTLANGEASPPAQEIDLRKARDKEAFLTAFARALGFPEYFGRNWDAFYDCLGDVGAERMVLLLRGASAFARAEPEEFGAALDTLADAAQLWRETGRSLLVVVELEAPVLAPELPEVSVRPA